MKNYKYFAKNHTWIVLFRGCHTLVTIGPGRGGVEFHFRCCRERNFYILISSGKKICCTNGCLTFSIFSMECLIWYSFLSPIGKVFQLSAIKYTHVSLNLGQNCCIAILIYFRMIPWNYCDREILSTSDPRGIRGKHCVSFRNNKIFWW